ncbi:hypothetical protein M422DRAFT_41492 [Sphaerobolus stellatus SS14]|nr:hypothetical protein M422DRAFT_41492 [Sphaerobolus stellatus SS14]
MLQTPSPTPSISSSLASNVNTRNSNNSATKWPNSEDHPEIKFLLENANDISLNSEHFIAFSHLLSNLFDSDEYVVEKVDEPEQEPGAYMILDTTISPTLTAERYSCFVVRNQLLPKPSSEDLYRPVYFLLVTATRDLASSDITDAADERVRNMFHSLIPHMVTPTLYGMCTIGSKIAFYEYSAAGDVNPEPNTEIPPPHENVPHNWKYDITEQSGQERIVEMVDGVKWMCTSQSVPS